MRQSTLRLLACSSCPELALEGRALIGNAPHDAYLTRVSSIACPLFRIALAALHNTSFLTLDCFGAEVSPLHGSSGFFPAIKFWILPSRELLVGGGDGVRFPVEVLNVLIFLDVHTLCMQVASDRLMLFASETFNLLLTFRNIV